MTAPAFFACQGAVFVLLIVLGLIAHRAGEMHWTTKRDLLWVTWALAGMELLQILLLYWRKR